MKISRNWLNNYLISNKKNEELVDLFTQLGLECSYKQIKSLPSNIVVGKVKTCLKHPNADRLKVCTVDIGNNEIIDIVCGAPNIDKDLVVPVAKVGSIINDFKIKKTKIRGAVSNGMICSGKELNLNDDHDGIMILDDDFVIGETLSNVLNLKNDTIFDFDITPNRGDCFSHLGISRELSVIENKKIKADNITLENDDFKTSDLVSVNIDKSDLCSRYACVIVKDIKVKESPLWLKNKLSSIGQNSINNIVDLANYIMFDLGQPVHVFDYDKIKDKKIHVRYAENSEKIECLDNEIRKLSSNDIIIADSKNPIAIAGVIGGLNSHVDNSTKNILIESAAFNELSIRRTAKKHDASTEASKRFERGVDASNIINVLIKFCSMLKDLTPAKISSDFLDISNSLNSKRKIDFNINKCNDFLGTDLTNKEVEKILFSLNIDFKNQVNKYKCFIPYYRNDLVNEVDLFEEVARVYGYENIPANEEFTFPAQAFVKDVSLLDDKVKSVLSSNGFNEHYSNSLYSDLDCKIDKTYKPIELINPLSQEMKYLRNSLLPGLLRALSFNERRGNYFVKMYELGNINSYSSKQTNISEQYKELMIVWMGNKIKNWKHSLYQDIYTIKGEIEHLFNMINVKDFTFKLDKYGSLDLYISNEKIGYLNKVSNSIKNSFDLNSDIYVSSIKIDLLNNFYSANTIDYNKINSFPSINRDISILVDNKYSNEMIENVIYKNGGNDLIDISLFDLYKDENLPKNSISLAYSLTFKSNNKTLTDKEIDKYMDNIIKNLKKKLNIIQR